MRRPPDDRAYLRDIVEAATNAQQFVADMDFGAFAADPNTVYAVTRAVEIIGEATKRLTEELRHRYLSIPWRDMAGMRDVVIHDYTRVDLRRVYDTVREDFPKLKASVETILEEASNDADG